MTLTMSCDQERRTLIDHSHLETSVVVLQTIHWSDLGRVEARNRL